MAKNTPKPPRRSRPRKTRAELERAPVDAQAVSADVETAGEEADPEEQARETAAAAFIEEALKRFRRCEQAEARPRKNQLSDLEFIDVDMWDKDIRTSREADGRPCLSIPRLRQPVKQVVNQIRANRPAIRVSPVDNGADPKTAEVLQDLIRTIEYNSDADVAYSTAAEQQAKMGLGYIRLLTRYADDDSDDLDIVIDRVRNRFTVYMDPACQKFDYSDAGYGFVVAHLTREQFKDRFGLELAGSLDSYMGVGDRIPDWLTEDAVRIAEYWYVEETPILRLQLQKAAPIRQGRPPVLEKRWVEVDAQTQTSEAMTALVAEGWAPRQDGEGQPITRKGSKRQVKFALITALHVLDGNKDRTAGRSWDGKWIPIIPLIGEETDVNGKVDYRGVVRDGVDAQRMGNFMKSAKVEAIAIAPRSPMIAAVGQIEDFQDIWDEANVKNFSVLPYKETSVDGNLVPMPQRMQASPDISAFVVAEQTFENDLKAVTGFVDTAATETAGAPRASGRAILARERQAQMGNSDYMGNMGRTLRQAGRVILDLLPHVITTARIQRLRGEDGKERRVVLHAGQPDEAAALLEDGIDGVFDITKGRYDVTVSMGPSSESRRQEAVEALTNLVGAVPATAPALIDLIVDNSDWPGKEKALKRLEKMVPPELQDKDPNAPQIPPELQQQMQQAQQVIDQLTATVQQLQQAAETKALDLEAKRQIAADDNASAERIAALEAQVELIRTQATLEAQTTQALIKSEMDKLAAFLQASRAQAPEASV